MRSSYLLLTVAFLAAFAVQAYAIVGGTFVESESDPVAQSTVSVHTRTRCTGSIIAPDLVITAAHCLEKARTVADISVQFGLNEGQDGKLRATGFKIHPSYKSGNKPVKNATYDIGVIRLGGKLPEGYRPAKIFPNASTLRPGQAVIIAGYGRTHPDQPIQRRVLRKVESKLNSHYNPLEIVVDSNRGASCNGDSGGPSFVEQGEETFLLGLIKGGNDDCDTDELHIRVDALRAWILQTGQALRGGN